jgi:hypothetical protein
MKTSKFYRKIEISEITKTSVFTDTHGEMMWLEPVEVTELLVDFLDSIRDYESESGHSLAHDERESIEFVKTHLGHKNEEE